MASKLYFRLQQSPISLSRPPSYSPYSPAPWSKRSMSITQTYYLAHKARAKLASEAARSEHNLRLLVGHANFLDSLMLDLADAEREQESWFNQSVHASSFSSTFPLPSSSLSSNPISDRWSGLAADDSDSSDSSDSDCSVESSYDELEAAPCDNDAEMVDHSLPANRYPLPCILEETEDEAAVDNMEEDYGQLGLVRTASHIDSPPELDHDADSSDDESFPHSPSHHTLALPGHDRPLLTGSLAGVKSTAHSDADPEVDLGDANFFAHGFFIPPRAATRLVSA